MDYNYGKKKKQSGFSFSVILQYSVIKKLSVFSPANISYYQPIMKRQSIDNAFHRFFFITISSKRQIFFFFGKKYKL